MKKMKIRITLTESMLGTKSANEELFTNYIAAKRAEGAADDELAAEMRLEQQDKSMTCFHRTEDGKPMLWNYQIKGFFKDACSSLSRVPKTKSSALKAYKKVIDGTIFIEERSIPLVMPEGSEVGIVERPLRAQTAQGERVALAKSESVPAGTYFDITLVIMNPDIEPTVVEWLDYGKFRGIGQWRNSGMGCFVWERCEG